MMKWIDKFPLIKGLVLQMLHDVIVFLGAKYTCLIELTRFYSMLYPTWLTYVAAEGVINTMKAINQIILL